MLKTFVQDYTRRMQKLKWFKSPVSNVLSFVSLIQCFNVYAILTYFIYPDCQTCTACDAGCRATIAGISWVFIRILNGIFFANNQMVRPIEAPYSTKFYNYLYTYSALSMILVLPWR